MPTVYHVHSQPLRALKGSSLVAVGKSIHTTNVTDVATLTKASPEENGSQCASPLELTHRN